MKSLMIWLTVFLIFMITGCGSCQRNKTKDIDVNSPLYWEDSKVRRMLSLMSEDHIKVSYGGKHTAGSDNCMTISVINRGDIAIKYIIFKLVPFNYNTPVYSGLFNRGSVSLKMNGPIAPRKYYRHTWKWSWYYPHDVFFKIKKIYILYKGNSSITIKDKVSIIPYELKYYRMKYKRKKLVELYENGDLKRILNKNKKNDNKNNYSSKKNTYDDINYCDECEEKTDNENGYDD